MKFTPDNITALEPNQVFVFGSNLTGRHGKGAALTARDLFGAETGVGEGPTGQCYAIPTKDSSLKRLPLWRIELNVLKFLEYARTQQGKEFLVTKVGCGLAGYEFGEIAAFFFSSGPLPGNVVLPVEFQLE